MGLIIKSCARLSSAKAQLAWQTDSLARRECGQDADAACTPDGQINQITNLIESTLPLSKVIFRSPDEQ
jgi:hypothetical protein